MSSNKIARQLRAQISPNQLNAYGDADMKSKHRPALGGKALALLAVPFFALSACSSDDDGGLRDSAGGGNGTGSDNPPQLQDDSFSVAPNVPFTGNVLLNDLVPEGVASLQVVPGSGPQSASGNFTINSNGVFTYDYNGSGPRSDSFVYTVTDSAGNPAEQASVQIKINTPPDAFSDDFAFSNGSGEILIADLLANDQDADGDELTFEGVFDRSDNQLSVIQATNASNQPVLRINRGNAVAPTFRYTIQDANGAEDSTDVKVRFIGGSDPDVFAKNDVYQLARGGSLSVAASGVLGNDVIDEGRADEVAAACAILVANQGPTQHDTKQGMFSLEADGAFTYFHDGSEQKVDTFNYLLVDKCTVVDGRTVAASDGRISAAATVSIQIQEAQSNEAPRARNETVNANQNGSVNVPILYNDTDREDGTPCFSRITTQPACGNVTTDGLIASCDALDSEQGQGVVRYQHDNNQAGCAINNDIEPSVSFSYEVRDSIGATDQATVTVRITNDENSVPLAVDDEVNVPANEERFIRALSNDSDPDGDIVILQSAGTICDNDGAPADCSTQQTAVGTVDVNPQTGVIQYTPVSTDIKAPPYTDVFGYTINDGRGESATGTVTVNVGPASENRAPIACDDPNDSQPGDNPRSGCAQLVTDNSPVQLFTVPACARHEIALNILINDTDLDPTERPPYRFQIDAVNDPNPPRHVFHATADEAYGVGGLRIVGAPSITGTGSSDTANNGRRSLIRISDDRRFIYYQHVGAEGGSCQLPAAAFVDTFTYTVADPRGLTDTGSVTVTVDPARLVGENDFDADNVPDSEDQCRPVIREPVPPAGEQTSTPTNTIFSNGCQVLATGRSLNGSVIDSDGDGVRGSDDACPDDAAPNQADGCPLTDTDGDGVINVNDLCPGTPAGDTDIDANGCSLEQRDDDGDGVSNRTDVCPATGPGLIVNMQGCADADNDGVADVDDNCPAVQNPDQANNDDDGSNGEPGDACDTDDDNDGVPDGTDSCPFVPAGPIPNPFQAGCPLLL